jgi:predicted ATPase/class 3 adenylate cyclase/tetratricopeptide (TPR) repeat protein
VAAGQVTSALTDLPTGTLTFLLTDIEGSTSLWEQHPAAMQAAIARHDAIIDTVLGQHGGRQIKEQGEGDSIFAVFTSPTAALAAVCALQQALLAERWPPETPLWVRLGLHTGEAELRGTGYYGVTVNRTAGIRSLAHGGQILLSRTTADLVRGALPAEVSLRSLGAHQLRGLAQPEEIYQVVHPNLPADFPPLASPQAHPNNLPVALTSFIGREREQAEVRALLGTARLVTLTGAGGAGKTRLALAVAGELLEEYPQGVWLVELAPLADPSLVPQAVAQALGQREEAGQPLLSTLLTHLKDRQLLLLLDNCEHLVGACAQLATALLRSCPGLRILATSREGLGVAGERLYRVPSLVTPSLDHLPPPEKMSGYAAVVLFMARAQERRADFVLTSGNARAVAQVCARLDGIPLAIELAAARIGSLPVEAIAARLDDRFRLLTSGPRCVVPRQQTLRSALDWSYDLLSEGEQRLLHRLSVFAGGCTLEAAEAVCVGDGIEAWEVLDLLGSLVNKSLVLLDEVGPDGEQGRYRMLETVRVFGRERLVEVGELEAMVAAHATWCLALAVEAELPLIGPEQDAWLTRLEREHDNLRAALVWSLGGGAVGIGLRLAVALCDFWLRLGHLSEGRTCIEHALLGLEQTEPKRATPSHDVAVTSQAPPWHVAVRLHETYGDILLVTAHPAQARAAFQQALDQVPITERIRQARLHRKSGNAWKAQSRYDEALHTYEMAESALGQDAAPWPEWWQEWAQIRLEQMDVHYWLNRWQAMAAMAKQTDAILEQYGTPAQRIRFLAALTSMYMRRDRYTPSDEAVATARAMLALSQEADPHGEQAFHRFLLSFVLLWHGDLDEAEEQMLRALAEAERTEDLSLQARCLTYLTIVQRKRGQEDDARHYSTRSLALAEAAGMLEYVGTACANLAWVAWCAGNPADTEAQGHAALAAWQQLPMGHASCCFQWTALWPLIAVALARGRVEEAIESARALLTPWQQRLPDALDARVNAALAAWDQGQADSTLGWLRDALAMARQTGYL